MTEPLSSFVLPPSDEGGGKPEGLDGGRDRAAYGEAGCSEGACCEFSPSVACGDSSLVRGSQGGWTIAFRLPSPGGEKRSPAADAGLGYKIWLLLRARTGGSGGHFALGKKAPRRPFCPLSAGGKWTISPQNLFCGGPGRFDRLAAHSGSLRHDGGTRRRSLLCGQTAQALPRPKPFDRAAFVLRLASL